MDEIQVKVDAVTNKGCSILNGVCAMLVFCLFHGLVKTMPVGK